MKLMKANGVLLLDFFCVVYCFKQERDQKTCFNCIVCNTKIDTASVYEAFYFSDWSNQPFLKKIKIVTIEHLKQKLSLENN